MKLFNKIIWGILPAVLLFASCESEENEQTIPAWISIDAMQLVKGSDDSWAQQEEGFFSNQIDGVEVVIFKEGDDAETNLGVFQLPCKIPVLRQGIISRIRISPVVRQNGISGTRISYPYYNYIVLKDVRLTPDSITSLDTINTTFKSANTVSMPWSEFFLGYSCELRLDTVVSRLSNNDTVCSGTGCGVVRVSSGQKTINFWADTTLGITDKSAYVYLELDYWSDFDFSVGFNGPRYEGASNEVKYALTIRKSTRWKKIYVNLGALWSDYNYNKNVRLYFTILNNEGLPGNLYLDNMKVVVM